MHKNLHHFDVIPYIQECLNLYSEKRPPQPRYMPGEMLHLYKIPDVAICIDILTDGEICREINCEHVDRAAFFWVSSHVIM